MNSEQTQYNRCTISLGDRRVGAGEPPYLIAEMSGNHNGDIDRAFKIMDAAKAAGVDAVKLQTYTADTMTIDAPQKDFKITGGPWDGFSLYQLYEWAHTPWEWHAPLFERGRELGLTVFSSPFDETAVDFLEQFDPPAYKVASFEAVDLSLIEKIAATGKPMIISTGMANLDEISEAVAAARDADCKDLILMHCVSGYPTPPEQSNLLTIVDLQQRFEAVVGLSDHTLTTSTALAAIALGASVIEKHITLKRSDGGPDAAFSLEPQEWSMLVGEAGAVWSALGDVDYAHKESEKGNLVFRRSIYVVKDIKKGEQLTEENIRRIRPGYGLAPKHYRAVLGCRAAADLKRGTPLSWDAIT